MSNIRREQLPYPDLADSDAPESTAARDGETIPANSTVIDRQSHFSGTYRADSDLRIEGTFEGEIDCNGTVVVAPDATLAASVRARNIVIGGTASGEFSCSERFTIRSTGEMRGKAQAGTVVVEEGAFFEGEFKMGTSSGKAPDAQPAYGGWESSAASERSTYSYGYESESAGGPGSDAERGGTYSGDTLWEEADDSASPSG